MLEVELDADLAEARTQHLLRLQESGVRAAVGQDGTGIQRVVEIEIERGAFGAEPEHLREPQIDLVQPIAVHRRRRNQVHGRVHRTSRERPAERLRHHRAGDVEVRRELRPGHALERAAHLHIHPRERIRAEELGLCLEWRLDAAVLLGSERRRDEDLR